MPFWPYLFQESQIAGDSIEAALQQKPRPLYAVGSSTDDNMLVYVRGPIRAVMLDDLAGLNEPSMAVLLPEQERALAQKNPTWQLVGRGDIVSMRTRYRVVEINQP